MASSDALRVLVFQVGDLLCGLPAELAREIIPTDVTTRIPGADPAVEGLANVRGTILTVINGHRLLGRTPVAEQEGATIVLDVGGRAYGLRVGRVHDLVMVPAGNIASGNAPPGVDPDLVHGVGQVGSEAFIVLDLPALLSPVVTI